MQSFGYETEATIKLHQQELLQAAERERLLGARQRSFWPRWALLRAGRALIAAGRWLEARYGGSEVAGASAARVPAR